jgi:hypothetical protein
MAFVRVSGAGYLCSPQRHDVGGDWLQRPKRARRCSCAMKPMALRSSGRDRRLRSAKVGLCRLGRDRRASEHTVPGADTNPNEGRNMGSGDVPTDARPGCVSLQTCENSERFQATPASNPPGDFCIVQTTQGRTDVSWRAVAGTNVARRTFPASWSTHNRIGIVRRGKS